MCGIIGFDCKQNAIQNVKDGLEILEYRGYDSCGIAYSKNSKINIYKTIKGVKNLKVKTTSDLAMGHTRWATHGKVSKTNAHPHLSQDGKIAVVHNGIIENYKEMYDYLTSNNITLISQTDTEVIPNLIMLHIADGIEKAIFKTVDMLKGSYSFLVMYDNEIYAYKYKTPLIVATTDSVDKVCYCSDTMTASSFYSNVYTLEDGVLTYLDNNELVFVQQEQKINIEAKKYDNHHIKLVKPKCFMEKEIFETEQVLKNTLEYYKNTPIELPKIENLVITACGTAYHSGLYLQNLLLKNTDIDCQAYIASELFGYNIKNTKTALILSQSGETADTIKTLEMFKKKGIYTMGITNVNTSTIAKTIDLNMPTLAGSEVAVASTKVFTAQMMVGDIIKSKILNENLDLLESKIDSCKNALSHNISIKNFAKNFKKFNKVFFLGKDVDYVLAKECSLKLKEVTYVCSEAYPAGELKHGTLSLIDNKTLVVAICTSADMLDKTLNALYETKSRNATVWLITNQQVENKTSDVKITYVDDVYGVSIVGQLFSLYCAQSKGVNPDKPRNLAKSVTVE